MLTAGVNKGGGGGGVEKGGKQMNGKEWKQIKRGEQIPDCAPTFKEGKKIMLTPNAGTYEETYHSTCYPRLGLGSIIS